MAALLYKKCQSPIFALVLQRGWEAMRHKQQTTLPEAERGFCSCWWKLSADRRL